MLRGIRLTAALQPLQLTLCVAQLVLKVCNQLALLVHLAQAEEEHDDHSDEYDYEYGHSSICFADESCATRQ